MGRGRRLVGMGIEGRVVTFDRIGDDAEDYTNE